MTKRITEFLVDSSLTIGNGYGLLGLKPANGEELPQIAPGQFVEVMAPPQSGKLLRRPISVHDVDYANRILWLLVRNAGPGTKSIIDVKVGDTLNILLPLGHGFSIPPAGEKVLLVGGGVGVAPLLYYAKVLKANSVEPVMLLGARSEADLLRLEEFRTVGRVEVTTEDGSLGVKGRVTDHPLMREQGCRVACCGPMPMMRAVARIAREQGLECEVSLENSMACGLGACLCCVEATTEGNLCVCTEGPVFNIKRLLWQD